MKKHTLLSTVIILMITNSAFAQLNWTKIWDYRYGGTAWDVPMAGIEAPGHGYLFAGKSLSDSSGNRVSPSSRVNFWHYWLVRVDSLGQKIWERNFGGTGDDFLASACTTPDGGFMIGGSSDSPISGDKSQASRGGLDYWVIKVDSTGHRQWDKTFGGSLDDELRSIERTVDGGFILCGDSRSGISGDKTHANYGVSDFWVVKINAQGVKQWDWEFGGVNYERAVKATQTADKGYFICGQSESPPSGNKTSARRGFNDYWVLKTDSIGNIEWDKDYGGLLNDVMLTGIKTMDGGYIVGGHTNSSIGADKTDTLRGWEDYWIVKIDSQGIKQWDKTFGTTTNEDEFSHIYQMSDHGYLFGVTSYSMLPNCDKSEPNMGIEQSWIIKTDSLGNKLWDKTAMTPGHDEATYIYPSFDKCYVLLGEDSGIPGGDNSSQAFDLLGDYWIVKYCPDETSDITHLTADAFNIYPNPFNDELHISWAIDARPCTVSLYDILGKKISSQSMNESTVISTSKLARGVYVLDINVDGYRVTKKICK
ncbi:MAG: T9SS type A sorting domain-containing protein [Bacteroidetes bacterium]|nr:T9SS type A sorting domain-containing protein [Bacteroidota bacterium]